MRGSGVIVAVLLAGLLGFACSSEDSDSDPGAEDAFTRAASANGIDVEATWLTDEDGAGEGLDAYPFDRFQPVRISLDTHSGDLSTLDMVQAATLDTASGLLEPEAWIASSDESHHRSGVLVFFRRELTPPVKLTLVLEDVTAEFEWEDIR